jgi:hypothetical protein
VFTDAKQLFFFDIGEIMMNACRKIFCVLGLTIALAGAAFAQSVAQTAAAKIDSCCCCSDSCDMTKKDAM